MLLHHFYSTTRVRPREVLVLRGSNLTGESGFGTICPNIGKERRSTEDLSNAVFLSGGEKTVRIGLYG